MKFKKFKKIVFLVFGSNHRISALGNFGKSKMYKDILLISLGGRFKSIFGRILYLLKIGNFIGIDSKPFLKVKKIQLIFGLTEHGKSLKNLRIIEIILLIFIIRLLMKSKIISDLSNNI